MAATPSASGSAAGPSVAVSTSGNEMSVWDLAVGQMRHVCAICLSSPAPICSAMLHYGIILV